MTALLIALFCGAGLLATASIVATTKHYSAAWLAIARQLDRGGEPPRKHLVYARRLKQQPARRARARARRAGRVLGHDAKLAARSATATRKSVNNCYSGFRMALLSDTLVFV